MDEAITGEQIGDGPRRKATEEAEEEEERGSGEKGEGKGSAEEKKGRRTAKGEYQRTEREVSGCEASLIS